jgi:hypothetical protein
MKNIFLLLSLILTSILAMSQTTDRTVLGSSGSELNDGSNSFEFTIGETLTETISSANHSIAQGFHQGTINVTSIEESSSFGYVNVFPNPTVESVQVEYRGERGQWQLHTFGGKLVSAGVLQNGINAVDMNGLAQATYILTLTNQKEIRSTYRVQKIL